MVKLNYHTKTGTPFFSPLKDWSSFFFFDKWIGADGLVWVEHGIGLAVCRTRHSPDGISTVRKRLFTVCCLSSTRQSLCRVLNYTHGKRKALSPARTVAMAKRQISRCCFLRCALFSRHCLAREPFPRPTHAWRRVPD